MNEHKIPLHAIIPQTIPCSEFMHLRWRDREIIRSIPSIRPYIPSEPTFNNFRNSLTNIQTIQFCKGACLSDPIKTIKAITGSSPWICIGGDCGGGTTKLGITYLSVLGLISFLPILVFNGSDHYSSLAYLNTPNLIRFDDESSEFQSIWDILQHLAWTHSRVYFNGDWLFINAVLGLQSASSNHPCPICTTTPSTFLCSKTALHYRTNVLGRGRVNTQLLVVEPTWIVPTPLHLVLGIVNRLIDKPLVRLFGKEKINEVISTIKQHHAPGKGGRSDFMALNGQEINNWFHESCIDKLLSLPNVPTDIAFVRRVKTIDHWMKELNDRLLSKDKFTRTSTHSLVSVIDDIHARWMEVTGDTTFPKLHMLHHVKSFIQQHEYLGLFSEAQIESCHAKMNKLINDAGSNCGKNFNEAMRRALALVVTQQLQPIITNEMENS